MTKLQYIGVAVLIVVIGAGVWFTQHKSDGGAAPHTEVAETPQTESARAVHASFNELLASKAAQKCTFSRSDDFAQSTGVSYIAQGVVRTDATITFARTGAISRTSTLVTPDTMYEWDGESGKGMKMSTSMMKSQGDTAPKAQDGTASAFKDINLAQEYDYQCEPWTVDQSLLTPPTTVSFTDPSAMMQNMMKGAVTGSDAGMVDGEMMLPPPVSQ